MRDSINLLAKTVEYDGRIMEIIGFYMVIDNLNPNVYIKLMEMKTGITINLTVTSFQNHIQENQIKFTFA